MEYNRRPWINNWLTDRNQTVGNKFCVNKQRVTHVRKTSCIMASEVGFSIKKKKKKVCRNFEVFSDNIGSVHGGSYKGNGLLEVY